MTGKRVLIVEDQPASAEALAGMLSRRGAKAEIAHTAGEAEFVMKMYRESSTPLDLVLADLQLPDSGPAATISWLKGLREQGLAVRALTEVNTPELVEAAANAGIRINLKGTTATGIMEAALYAMLEADPSYRPAAAAAIVENRGALREFPTHARNWFFRSWPRWVQISSGLLAMLTCLVTVVSMSAAVLHQLDVRSVAGEVNRETTRKFEEVNAAQNIHIAQNDLKIRSVEDDRIKVIEAVSSVKTAVEKLDTKFETLSDLIHDDHGKTGAMWNQRLQGKTNEQVQNTGDTPTGPKQP